MKQAATFAAIAVLALACGPARAQDSSYFDGFYAGILGGAAGNEYKNLYPTGGKARGEIGAFAGWNTDLTPDVVVGGELMIAGATDFAGTYSGALLALGQIGRMVDNGVAFYLVGGGGVFGSAPVVAFGARAEVAVYNDIALRWEMLNFVQAAPSSGGSRPGVTGQMFNLGVLWHMNEGDGARAAMEHTVPDFEGLYTGATFSIHHNATYNFFPDVGFGGHPSRADFGGLLGWNYRLNEWVVAGVEGQAGMLSDSSGDIGYDAFALGRLGVTPLDGLMAYGVGGLGVVQDKPVYGVGAGVEHGSFASTSLRAEVLAYGELGAASGLTGWKYTAGLVWDID